MPICCQAQWMPLPPTIQMVINERRTCSAASVQLQRQHREFNTHLSGKGADRLCCNHTRYKREPGSHRHFILVHIVAPCGPAWLWLPWELNKITAIAIKLPSKKHVQHTCMLLPLRVSKSMRICLQWEGQENRLQDRNKKDWVRPRCRFICWLIKHFPRFLPYGLPYTHLSPLCCKQPSFHHVHPEINTS